MRIACVSNLRGAITANANMLPFVVRLPVPTPRFRLHDRALTHPVQAKPDVRPRSDALREHRSRSDELGRRFESCVAAVRVARLHSAHPIPRSAGRCPSPRPSRPRSPGSGGRPTWLWRAGAGRARWFRWERTAPDARCGKPRGPASPSRSLPFGESRPQAQRGTPAGPRRLVRTDDVRPLSVFAVPMAMASTLFGNGAACTRERHWFCSPGSGPRHRGEGPATASPSWMPHRGTLRRWRSGYRAPVSGALGSFSTADRLPSGCHASSYVRGVPPGRNR